MAPRVLRLLGFAFILSCGDGPVDRLAHLRAPPPTPPTPTPTPLPTTPAGPLASRVEAQESFDRARSALMREDFPETARQVVQAAAFMRSHAVEAGTGAVAALQGAAKELDVLAERLQKGEPPTLRTLDRVFANANRAEAQHHLARVFSSPGAPDHRATGEELLMAVDHLERSARYLRQPSEAQSAHAFSQARGLATRMYAGEDPGRAAIKRVVAPLEAELRRLCRIIDQEAEACAVEQARDRVRWQRTRSRIDRHASIVDLIAIECAGVVCGTVARSPTPLILRGSSAFPYGQRATRSGPTQERTCDPAVAALGCSGGCRVDHHD